MARLIATMVLFTGLSAVAFAESAPVYDVDNMPQQFESNSDTSADMPSDNGQDLPPPPSPDQESTFAPLTSQTSPSSNASRTQDISRLTPDQRLHRLEQQINNMQNNDAAQRMDSLQNQVQLLRGQVEQLTHQLQLVQNQQKTVALQVAKAGKTPDISDVSKKANDDAPDTNPADVATVDKEKADAAKQAKIDANDKSTGNQPNVAEEQQIYQTAYNLIKAKKYDDAVNTLKNMLKKYPSGQFASNAHYWLGELYGLMGKNDQALTEFNTIINSYQSSPRLSDAQLKIGLIFASQSKWSDAKAAFKKVINHYPGTASARLAAEHLKQIRQAGN